MFWVLTSWLAVAELFSSDDVAADAGSLYTSSSHTLQEQASRREWQLSERIEVRRNQVSNYPEG